MPLNHGAVELGELDFMARYDSGWYFISSPAIKYCDPLNLILKVLEEASNKCMDKKPGLIKPYPPISVETERK